LKKKVLPSKEEIPRKRAIKMKKKLILNHQKGLLDKKNKRNKPSRIRTSLGLREAPQIT
jgi:hypothetical protein